jgi:5-methylcytosine-specific restriction endonuclease McrA
MVLGRESRCRECRRALNKTTQAKNGHKYAAQKKRRYHSDPAPHRHAARRWYAEHKSDPELRVRRLARSKAHSAQERAERPDHVRERKRVWRKANPEKTRIEWAKKRTRKACVPSDLTEAQWLEILECFDRRCAYCLCKLTRQTKDHVIAIARGGHDTAQNVVPACQSCNSRKHDRPVFTMVNTQIRYDAVI